MELKPAGEVVGASAGLEDARECVIVGPHVMAQGHVGEEAEGVAVEPVVDVAPDHDVEEDGVLMGGTVEHVAGPVGVSARGEGAHELDLDGGVREETRAVEEAGVEGPQGARGAAVIQGLD